MTNEKWATSTNAPAMLEALYLQDPAHFTTLIPELHRFFLACCWKIQHLLPQQNLRNGLNGAKKWIDGEISEEDFRELDWHAEAECFALDNTSSPEGFSEIRKIVKGIKELQQLSFAAAHQKLLDAAYFANCAMCYSELNTAPYDHKLCTSEFLCADLLREYIQPNFQGPPKKDALEPYRPIPFRTAFGKIKGPLPNLD